MTRQSDGMGPLPNFLIVGAMRSGTTSLARYLDAHPDVFIAPGKELHFFDLRYDRGLGWYREQFARAGTEPLIGEATQSYLYDAEAAERMALHLPGANLIAILRDPVERAYSHYWLNRARDLEPLSFADAIEAEPDRLTSDDKLTRLRYSYIDRGRYVRQLRRMCERFNREALHVLLFEELRDAPRETYRAVCTFLGADDAFGPHDLGEAANAYVSFRSVPLRQLGKRMPRPLRKAIGKLNTRRSSYPPMDPAVRGALKERLAGDNSELAAWLDRDLSAWNR